MAPEPEALIALFSQVMYEPLGSSGGGVFDGGLLHRLRPVVTAASNRLAVAKAVEPESLSQLKVVTRPVSDKAPISLGA